MEEYDFDDYNSVASTASLLNIQAELAQEENNFAARNHLQLPASQNGASQPRVAVQRENVINGTDTSTSHLKEQLLRISKVQASISKVRNWSKFGTNGTLNKDEWRDVLLEAAQEGDLKRVVSFVLIFKSFAISCMVHNHKSNELHLKWYYTVDQKVTFIFSSDFETMFTKHSPSKILILNFEKKTV